MWGCTVTMFRAHASQQLCPLNPFSTSGKSFCEKYYSYPNQATITLPLDIFICITDAVWMFNV